MKILYVLPEMKLGGTEKHFIQLAAGLRRRGRDARILTLFLEGILAEEVREQEIPFACLNLPYRWNLKTFSRIYSWLRQEKPEVLQVCLFGFDFFALFPAALLKIPARISCRRELAEWQKGKHRLIQNLGNFFASKLVCCSSAVRDWAIENEKINPQKIAVLYNGVDLSRFSVPSSAGLKVRDDLGIPFSAPLAGTVANFAVEKGHPYLMEAIAAVLKKKPGTWFLLIGAGPQLKEMKQQAASLGFSKQIIFTGFRSDIPELLSAMDVFVLASISEGFPNVLLEAMAMAKPVVSTFVGGIPELIENGRDGILVPPRDANALAEEILSCLADPKSARQMGERACQKIQQKFSLDRMIDEYETLYSSLLKEKGIETETVGAQFIAPSKGVINHAPTER